MIVFLLMNLITGYSALLLVNKALRIQDKLDVFIGWFLLYLSQIVIIELALGMLNMLYLKNVFVLNLAVLLLTMFFTRKIQPFSWLNHAWPAIKQILRNKIILIAIAIILGFALIKIFVALSNPPFGWDNLSYHFVFPVEWLKNGNLENPITICDDPSPAYYPINSSLYFLWLMFPFKSVFMANIGQAPFFILAFLAIYNICRKARLSQELSFYAAGLFIITPNIFKQLEIAYVDMVLTGLFLAGLNFLISFYQNRNFKSFLGWALSFGLMLGTKTSAILYGVPLVLFFIFLLFKKREKRAIFYALLFIFISLVLGGYTYVKNFILTANPIFPAEIILFGKKILSGVMPFSSYRNQWTAHEFNLAKLLFHEGMGGQFIALGFPALLFSFIFAVLKPKGKSMAEIFLLSLPQVLYLIFWFFMPQLWVRYLYPCFAVSFIAAFYLLDKIKVPLAALRTFVIICFLASAFELAGHAELFASIIASVVIFAILILLLNLKYLLRIGVVLILILLGITIKLSIDYDKIEFNRYLTNSPFLKEDREAWFWLNSNTNGSQIAYAGIPLVLPLYGENFKNDVFYVSVNKVNPVKLHFFPNARYLRNKDFWLEHKSVENDGNFRERPDFTDWMNNLKAMKTDFLVTYSLRKINDKKVFSIEDEWAKAHPENFSLVFSKPIVNIYKIR